MASLELKIELRHDVRNHEIDVSTVEERLMDELNLHRELVESVRFGGGRSAGALFVVLDGSARYRVGDYTADVNLDKIAERAVKWAEKFGYADNMSSPYYSVSIA